MGLGCFPFDYETYLTQSDSRTRLSGILSLIRVGSLSTPRLFSALPPVNICEASPKAISGRTSYIRVRLEFLRYPHLIRQHFNGRALHTRFPCGSDPSDLNLAAYNSSPDHSTKGTTSRLNALCVLVNIWFQVLFTPLPRFFSPFPHGTSPLSVIG